MQLRRVAGGLETVGRVKRPPSLDVLGPGVGQDEILDAHLSVIKDVLAKLLWDLAPVPDILHDRLFRSRSIGGRNGRLRAALGAGAPVGRLKGRGRVGGVLVAVQDPGCVLKDASQLFEVGRRQVDLELGATGADEVDVDAQALLEAGPNVHLAGGAQGSAGLLFNNRHVPLKALAGVKLELPLGDAAEEGNILAREIPERGELLEGLRVLD